MGPEKPGCNGNNPGFWKTFNIAQSGEECTDGVYQSTESRIVGFMYDEL